MVLNLDLDGVFANFDRNFLRYCGFPYRENPKKAWGILERVDHLFLNLDPIPGAHDFFNAIIHNLTDEVDHVRILTALPRLTGKLATAEADKKAWVAKHLSDDIEVICCKGWKSKTNYCKPGDILVDDMLRNIDAWFGHKGIGVWHEAQDQTIAKLYDLGILTFDSISRKI